MAAPDPSHPAGDPHPLLPVIPLMGATLRSIGEQARHPMVVTDARGTVLWHDEHSSPARHAWTCAASPVRCPDHGDVIGAVDVAAGRSRFHPSTLALVTAAAQLAEGHLRTRQVLDDDRVLARHLPLLTALDGAPGALLAASGRVIEARPAGWLPARVALPAHGDRVALGAAGTGLLEPLPECYLLRLTGTGA